MIVDSKDMNEEVLESFNSLLDFWNSEPSGYLGWVFDNLDFNKDYPDEIEFSKIIVDDWLLESGLKEEALATVLIKYVR